MYRTRYAGPKQRVEHLADYRRRGGTAPKLDICVQFGVYSETLSSNAEVELLARIFSAYPFATVEIQRRPDPHFSPVRVAVELIEHTDERWQTKYRVEAAVREMRAHVLHSRSMPT